MVWRASSGRENKMRRFSETWSLVIHQANKPRKTFHQLDIAVRMKNRYCPREDALFSSSSLSPSSLKIPKSQINPTPFFILFFSVLIRTTLCYVNPHFQACEPQTCGNGPNITYPFRIEGKQESFCGFPGFGLFCASNGFPMLNLSNTFYIVDEIFYDNLSLRVFNPNFRISNSTKCLSPSDKLTLDFRYAVAPNQKEVFLFFDCDLPSLPQEMKQNVLGCSEGNRTRSVLGMAVDDAAEKLKYAKDNCRGGPTTRTVVGNVEGGIREALGRGLLLKPKNWTASKCETCRRTGGRCGFLAGDAFDFTCFCRDRDHLHRCHPGLPLSLILSVYLSSMPIAICSSVVFDY